MKAKEFITGVKPRNFVAKNAKTGGAGAHKDKKKSAKQGDVKHKKQSVEESVQWQNMDPKSARRLLSVYRDLSSDLEQHGDEEQASALYKELASTAREEGVQSEFRNLCHAAQQSAHMDFDTNPGHFKNWFPYVGELLDHVAEEDDEPDYEMEPDDNTDDSYALASAGHGSDEDYESINMERVRDPEDWDEGNTEPPNNFAVYINGKKWKVFAGRGTYADDQRERQHYRQLQDWAAKKSASTGKKWTVHVTGEAPTA